MRLSRISKLVGGLLISASLSLVAVWQYALTNIAIGGPTYTEITDAKDLVADVLPPPQYVIEPFLLATLALTDPETASARQAESVRLKAEYDKRHLHWSGSSIDSQARDLLLSDAHRPAADFWRVLFDEFYPALASGDQSKATRAYEALSQSYSQHRSAVDKVVVRASTLVQVAEEDAERLVQNVDRLTSLFLVVGFALVCAFVWALCVHYSQPIERLHAVMEELSSGNFDVVVPYTARVDEIGAMARTLLVFREQGHRKIELDRQNKQLNDALSERTASLEQTLDHMAQGIILMRDGKISLCNQNALRYLNVDSEAAAAELLLTCEDPGNEPDIQEERLLSRLQWRRDLSCENGRSVEIRRCKGSTLGDVYTISDVTTLKQRQDQLEKALVTASHAIDARSRFFSTMSHEMRTPLNGVIGSLELLSGYELDGDHRELVEIATKCCDALLAQINDVLDFSKIEAGKLELNPEPMSISDLVSSALAVMAPVAMHSQTTLRSEIVGEVPAAILADGSRLRQVLLNFLSNALKFTRHGTVTVRVSRVGGNAEKPEIECAVTDTGAGISRDRLPMLFKEFSMVHEVTIETSGTGLGLAISKKLIDAMGGTVGVESVEGLGSRFWFRLALPAVGIGEATEHRLSQRAASVNSKLRILLVDDNQTNRLVGQRLLVRDGHSVETARNGRDAVQAAASGKFDLILMDVSMPGMDGCEATRQIRNLPPPHCFVRIIALTANAVQGDREKFLAAGMDDYLSKPLRLSELRERLTGVVSSASGSTLIALPEPQTVPLIDLDHLDMISGGDVAAVSELLRIYCGEITERNRELEAAIEGNSIQALKDAAHAIAGASASAGCALLASEARQVENAIVELDYQRALEIGRKLQQLVVETHGACVRLIDCGALKRLNATIAA